MSTKQKLDVKVLKGQEAEDKILEYLRLMNRPYGAVDVSANLKGAVPKTATQKILVALAEKGELIQKTYGKTTFFVANQSKIDTLPSDQIAVVETEYKKIDEENRQLAAQVKASGVELARLKNTPSDDDLNTQMSETRDAIEKRLALLQPLRSGTKLVSAENLAQVDADWMKWRAEWIRRRKIFMSCVLPSFCGALNYLLHRRRFSSLCSHVWLCSFWHLVTDTLSPQDAEKVCEDLGIEFDTAEHISVENGPLCANSKPLKRKRKGDSP
ncbi:TBPIP-domain-containing protein [Marasmius fiardii PR-910]|nr:TBPIP-domain-containing protein [Marasmius fiardii PR-910]